MESKRQRRYFQGNPNNGAHAWTPYDALSVRHAVGATRPNFSGAQSPLVRPQFAL